MKRVIENSNLAFNHMVDICGICKRWNGEFTETDNIVCKYNTDDKGLRSGLVKNFMQNFKCKYYKRNVKFRTCSLQMKNYSSTINRKTTNIVYNRGTFNFSKVEK